MKQTISRLLVRTPLAAVALLVWVTPSVSLAHATSVSARTTVIVQTSPGAERRVGLELRTAGAQVVRSWHIIPALEVSATRSLLPRLARLPGVRWISPNARVRAASFTAETDNQQAANVYHQALHDDVSGRFHEGRGVGVALIDTGVTPVGDLEDRTLTRVSVDPTIPAGDLGDGYGHGTFLAGVIAGQGSRRRGFQGVSPQASLISVKASDDQGRTNSADVLTAIQWVVDHRAQYNIRVINLSLNSPVQDSYLVDPLDAAVEFAWLHGITVIVAAGNCGDGADSVASDTGTPYCPNVPAGQAATYAPANDPFVITVGATNDQGTSASGDDIVAPWSSHGTSLDGTSRPDVVAPGSHIISMLPTNSVLAGEATPVQGNFYRLGGTSVAAAEVSGVAALAFAAHPDWTPDSFKGALIGTAQPITGSATGYPDATALTRYAAAPPLADQGLRLNNFIVSATCQPDCQPDYYAGLTWDLLTWDLLTWDLLTWDLLTWDSFTWHQTASGWRATTWTGISPSGGLLTQDLLTWDLLTWDLLTWDSNTWATSPSY